MIGYIKKFLNTNISFLIILVVVVFSLYGKAINFELTSMDDTSLIRDSISYISSIENIPKFFTTSCFYSNDHPFYRPLLTLSFAVETIFFGYNLKIYHLTNILLFVFLLYLLFIFFTHYLKANKTVTKFILLLFAVHPAFSLVYVWIPARNDSLFAISAILSLIALIKFLNSDKLKHLILFSFLFCTSLLLKETSIVLPLAYAAFIYCFNYKITKKQIYKIVSSLFLLIVFYFLLRSYSITGTHIKWTLSNIQVIILNIIHGFLLYIEKLLYPYDIPVLISRINVMPITIITNIIFILFFVFIYLKNIINKKTVIFSLFWFLLFLFPTFFLLANQILFHRLLVPIIFLLYILIVFTEYILNKYGKYERLSIYLIAIFTAVFVTLFYGSFFQQNKYKDQKTYIVNSYLDSPHSPVACTGMAILYLGAGNIEKATELMQFVIETKPTLRYYLNYAAVLALSGRVDEAEKAYLEIEKDLKMRKEEAYLPLSAIYYVREDYKKADEYIRKAYELKPYDTDILKQFAKVSEKTGNTEQALEIYENLLKVDRDNKEYENKIRLLKKQEEE